MRKTIYIALGTIAMSACSTTSSLEPGEQLFTGLEPIAFTHDDPASEHLTATQEEVEAALATAPNGALFGSSYHRTPFPYGLWIWNACHGSSGVIKKWLNNSFGNAPVLLQNVNPNLRSIVATNVLQNNGYFNGHVDYETIEGKPERTRRDTTLAPRTAKVRYTVSMGQLYTLDSVAYTGFDAKALKAVNTSDRLLHRGSPFSVSTLDAERQRIYNTLRNQGYYYYQKPYVSYFADTTAVSGKVQLQLRMSDSLPDEATRRWVIGTTEVQIRRSFMEQMTDSVHRRYLTIRFAGKKPPLRPGVLLRTTTLRPGDLFSQDRYTESLEALNNMGIFSSVDISFKPRTIDGQQVYVPDTVADKGGVERAGAGVLDMVISSTLDKPFDVTFTATANGKTNGRMGPELSLGLNKRNAFGGGELLSAELSGSYEFQTSLSGTSGSSYDLKAGLSLTIPRLLLPRWLYTPRRHRHYVTPSTIINFSGETIRRAGFFTKNMLTGGITYYFQPSATSQHQFTPLSLVYGHTPSYTSAYFSEDSLDWKASRLIGLRDEFTPMMRYKYTYTSPTTSRNPLVLQLTLTEAGNLTNAVLSAVGSKSWNDKEHEILAAPYSQFLKAEADIKKTWAVGMKSAFVAHAYLGYIHALGNSSAEATPYSELFFAGGANDLRGFTLRSIGPGGYHHENQEYAYLNHNGNAKALINLEYRPHIFGSLYGAVFLDAGNVWNLQSKGLSSERRFDVGLDVGAGFRYDLDFFVLRLDWGIALHTPYTTGTSGFFNIPKFRDAQCINFAIGYPF